MTILIATFTAFSIILGAFLIWLGRPRITIPALTILLVVVWYGGVETLGRNRPMEWEWRNLAEMPVLSYRLDEPRAIYIWLDTPGEPAGYRLPWDKEVAKQLQGAAEQSKEQGAQLMFQDKKFDQSQEDRTPLFYPAPQPRYPPKQ